jgi:N-methylhydantoinase A
VPNVPGHFSAWGMLMTDLRNDWVQTMVARADTADPAALNRRWGELEAESMAFFANEGVAAKDIILTRAADMRYLGQEHTVKTSIPSGDLAGRLGEIRDRFDVLHQQTYAFVLPKVPTEFVNIHLTGFGRVPKPEVRSIPAANGLDQAKKGERMVNYDAHGWRRSAIYERERLGAGARLSGPAVIEEPAASTVVFPGQLVEVDRYGNLIISAAPEGMVKTQ